MHQLSIASLAVVAALVLVPRAEAQHHGHGTPPVSGKEPAPAHAGMAGHKEGAMSGNMSEHMSGWKELDAYHMTMMAVWHPAKASGDLKPIRAQATTLVQRADTLAKAAVPAACDTPEMRADIAKVNTESAALASLAANGPDADVLAALKALHERFERVNHACKVTGDK